MITKFFNSLNNPALIHNIGLFSLLNVLAIVIFILIFLPKSVPNIYGNARFAKKHDAKKAGLFATHGILLGKSFGKKLILDGYEHVTVFAPTGTGKTTRISIPNLLHWQHSCVVNDIKLQLYKHTADYRRSIGQKVFLWNPAAPDGITHSYNPLDMISGSKHTRIDDIQKIAAIFIPDNPRTEPIWAVHSRFLFIALVLYVLDTKSCEKNIAEVVRLVKTSPDFHRFVIDILTKRNDLDPLCRYNFMKFAELHEKTRLSILATFQSYFELFDNPLVVAATNHSDFDIRNLRKEKITIYVGVTNDNLVRLSPLLTVFYQQVCDVMTRKIPDETEPYGVLMLLDEFSALRRMESFHKNIGLFREYHVRVVILIQELSQLYDLYGRDGAKVFINAKIRIAFTQNDEETCQLISSMLGNTTVAVKQRSKAIGSSWNKGSQHNEATHYVSKPLMLPQEIRLLPDTKALILIQGHLSILADKVVWFKKESLHRKIAKT